MRAVFDETEVLAGKLVDEVVTDRPEWYAPQRAQSRSRREMIEATAEALRDGWTPADIAEAWNCCQYPTGTALTYVLRRLANVEDVSLPERFVPGDTWTPGADRQPRPAGSTTRNACPEPTDPAAYLVEHLAADTWRVRPKTGRPPARLVHLNADTQCDCQPRHQPGCINHLIDLGDCNCPTDCVHVEAVHRHGHRRE